MTMMTTIIVTARRQEGRVSEQKAEEQARGRAREQTVRRGRPRRAVGRKLQAKGNWQNYGR